MNKQYIDWSNIDSLVEKLCEKINQSPIPFENILGVPRGGLIPAVMVSHKLGIPLVKHSITPYTLVIDDICDSGHTLKKLVNRYQTEFSFPLNLKTAVLHYKPHTSVFEPTIWAKQWSSNDWVLYPWERKDSKSVQDYKVKVGELN